MTPKQTQQLMQQYEEQLAAAKRLVLKVGLPEGKVGVYDSGESIMEVGATHEYGTPKVPRRSFLRGPFHKKRGEINHAIDGEFKRVFEGRGTAKDGLGRVGVVATNISKGAFRSNGYGEWAPLAPITQQLKAEAGKTTPLIWTGALRQSITWEVSNAASG